MNYILPAFKAVSVTFACLAVATGAHALWKPVGFAASFGMPLQPLPKKNDVNINPNRLDGKTAASYVSLMGVRQLATGFTLLAFASQGKWTEMATILVILGLVVATTDGFFLYRSGAGAKGLFHVIPGALIALLAGSVRYLTP
ncbi:DUF4267 domain-containing protein [Lichenicola cladoniae]|uniref:DUF4267 domain-containing protein n=1 Tax=Lichenicola cladoniae TaxID=1484109 RepID=A0A6M8HQP7_9PROT|nr:DUF4267 domain-containing protein [Lichenicola cladoniae]NPD68107.1 DUF4267 domain-containing protein [Acetobacteraceae bacterium]QKE90678.1 DUF4267 domain-containing protein [Lichenicola cladoniae]